MVLTSSDYIQIIVSVIYAIALFYTVITFRRSKELDQIRITETIFKDLRDLDRDLSKIPSGSQHDSSRKELYSRIINTIDCPESLYYRDLSKTQSDPDLLQRTLVPPKDLRVC